VQGEVGLQEVSSIDPSQLRLIVTAKFSEVPVDSCRLEWDPEMRYRPCYGRSEVSCTIHPCLTAPPALSAAAGLLRCSLQGQPFPPVPSSSSGYRCHQNCCYCPEQGMTRNHRRSTSMEVLGLKGRQERRASWMERGGCLHADADNFSHPRITGEAAVVP